MIRLARIAVFAAVIGLGSTDRAFACECALTPVEAVDGAEMVFIGRLVHVDSNTSISGTGVLTTFGVSFVDVKVEEVFKGKVKVKDAVTVRDGIPGLCYWRVFSLAKKGERYLVYARRDNSDESRLSADLFCSRTGLVNKAADQLAVIRPYAKAHPELRK